MRHPSDARPTGELGAGRGGVVGGGGGGRRVDLGFPSWVDRWERGVQERKLSAQVGEASARAIDGWEGGAKEGKREGWAR